MAVPATWPSKEWPVGNWRGLLADLPRRLGRPVALIVPPGREESWRGLAQAPGVVALPPAGLPRVLQIVGGADALVAVDGGVMHAGVAMGVPTVALFGPTDPGTWFPYGEAGPYRVLATRPDCHPCHLHRCDAFVCLPELAPDQVAEALSDVLAPEPRGGDERR